MDEYQTGWQSATDTAQTYAEQDSQTTQTVQTYETETAQVTQEAQTVYETGAQSTYGAYRYTPYEGRQDYTPTYLAEPEEEIAPEKKGRGGRIATVAIALILAAAIISGMAYTVLRSARPKPVVQTPVEEPLAQGVEGDGTEGDTSGGGATNTNAGDASGGASQGSSTITLNQSTETARIETDVTEVVRATLPSIVMIDNSYVDRVRTIYGVYEEDAIASGSGIIIGKSDTELLIVTNNHVISGANELKVYFIGNGSATAQVRGTNAGMDLAVIVVQMADLDSYTKGAIDVAVLGDSDTLQLGEPVIAIGNALGIGQSVTTGVVSALDREIEMEEGGGASVFIQTDAAINHGNSGGALINGRGEVIGINTAKFEGIAEGMGFAIPITKARETIERLMNLGVRDRVGDTDKGYFGISVTDPDDMQGAYISAVQTGGAADKAGLQVGDVIVAIEEVEITSTDDLLAALYYFPAGETVEITINRKTAGGYVEQKLQVTLQSAEETATD